MISRAGFFLKWKGHFSFWGSAFQVFRQCGGASIRTRFCENYLSGDLDFRKTETNLFLHFVRAEEGSGEEFARAFWNFGGLKFKVNQTQNYLDIFFCIIPDLKESILGIRLGHFR